MIPLPVLVSPVIEGDKLTVTAVSDLLDDRDGLLVLRVMDFNGNIRTLNSLPIGLKANSSAIVFTGSVAETLKGARPAEVLLSIQLYDLTRGKAPVVSALPGNPTTGGKLLSSNIAYFAPVKDVKLPKPAIKTTVKAVGNDIAIGLTSATLVKNLCLSHEAEGRFSDNYFDMLPNAPVIVRFTAAKPMTVKAFEAGLSTMHMAEIQG